MLNPLCIYHASCTDGFGAAWVVREFYKNKKSSEIPKNKMWMLLTFVYRHNKL